MTLFDWIAGLILVVALVKGGVNGLIKELASLAALVAGLLGAIFFGKLVEGWLGRYFEFQYMGVAAFLIIFFLIVAAIHLLANGLDKLMESAMLGPLNRLAGALFSALKYAFLISIFISVYNFFSGDREILNKAKAAESLLYEPIKGLAPTVFPYLEFRHDWSFPEESAKPTQVASFGNGVKRVV